MRPCRHGTRPIAASLLGSPMPWPCGCPPAPYPPRHAAADTRSRIARACQLVVLCQVCRPMQVVLTGVPLGKGLLTLTGCRLTALGVTWKQPWTPLVGSAHASPSAGSQEAGGLAQVDRRFRAGHGLHAALQSLC